MLVLSFYVVYMAFPSYLKILALPVVFLIFSLLGVSGDFFEGVILSAMDYPFMERTASRVYLALYMTAQDNSIGYRAEIYNFFWRELEVVWFGYGPRNYAEFFHAVSDPLAAKNPHSLLIDIYLAFGLFGFVCFVVFFVAYICVALQSRLCFGVKFYAFFVVFLFFLLSFVPSSVFRLPVIFLPVLIMASYVYSLGRLGYEKMS